MSMELYDERGSLGHLATASGLGDARRAVEKLSGIPELKTLFETGLTKVPKAAANEAMKAAYMVNDDQVRSTLVNMGKLLRKANKEATIQL